MVLKFGSRYGVRSTPTDGQPTPSRSPRLSRPTDSKRAKGGKRARTY